MGTLSLKKTQNRKKYIGMSIILLSLFFLSLFLYKKVIHPCSQQMSVNTVITTKDAQIELLGGGDLEQSFLGEENIRGVELQFLLEEHESPPEGILRISIIDTKNAEELSSATLDLSKAVYNQRQRILFPEGRVEIEPGKSYLLKISGNHEGTLKIRAKEAKREGCLLTINGKEQKLNMSFSQVLDRQNNFLVTYYFIGVFLLLFVVGVMYYQLIIKRKLSIEKGYLIIAFVIGITYLVVMRAGAIPDEEAHYSNSYVRSNQFMGLEQSELSDVDDGDAIYTPTALEGLKNINDSISGRGTDVSTNQNTTLMVDVPVYLHTITALGITLGRVLGLDNVFIFYLGRLFNLLFYLGCTYFAVKKIPFGKIALAAICMFPMSIHLAASYSYDAVINAVAFLFISYIFYLLYEDRTVGVKDILILGVAGAMLACSKTGAYIPICLLIFLLPKSKFASLKNRALSLIGMLVIWGAWYVAQVLPVASTVVGSKVPYIEWAGENGYTLSMILTSPLHSIYMFLNSLWELVDDWIINMVGRDLGWLNTPIMSTMVILYIIIFLIGILQREGERFETKISRKVMMMVLCCLSAGMVIAGMWLGWTPESRDVILGVQGRYFLPFLPMFIYILRNKLVFIKRNLDRELLLSILVLQIITVGKVITVTL